MKKKTLAASIAILFVLYFGISGCYYNSEEDLYPNPVACDTTHVTYSATITGLLNAYGCINCHNSATLSGNINLASFAEVKSKIADGRLWGAINHLPGYSPMPEGGNKMSACDISKVKIWMDAGAPQN